MKYYAGLDLGGTFIKCGIVDENGKVLIKDKIPTGGDRPWERVAADMAKLASSLAEKAGVKLCGAGIGSPGLIDSESGVIVYSNNLRWDYVPLGKTVSDALGGTPVRVANDANAAALGEKYFGAGAEFDSVVFVTLGTGVGGGIVINGKLFEGNRSAGAEIGHTVICMGGEQCTCGRKGCFEAYASATALIRETKKAMKNNPDSKLWEIVGGDLDKVEGKTAFDGLHAGDKVAAGVIDGYVNCLAEGVANICNEFHPEAVLIGGGVSAAGDALMVPLREKVKTLIYGVADYAPVQILRATLGNDAGMFGAACLAMEK